VASDKWELDETIMEITTLNFSLICPGSKEFISEPCGNGELLNGGILCTKLRLLALFIL